jgi:hypothetical protein
MVGSEMDALRFENEKLMAQLKVAQQQQAAAPVTAAAAAAPAPATTTTTATTSNTEAAPAPAFSTPVKAKAAGAPRASPEQQTKSAVKIQVRFFFFRLCFFFFFFLFLILCHAYDVLCCVQSAFRGMLERSALSKERELSQLPFTSPAKTIASSVSVSASASASSSERPLAQSLFSEPSDVKEGPASASASTSALLPVASALSAPTTAITGSLIPCTPPTEPAQKRLKRTPQSDAAPTSASASAAVSGAGPTPAKSLVMASAVKQVLIVISFPPSFASFRCTFENSNDLL